MRGLTAGYLIGRLALLLLTVWLGATAIFVVSQLAPSARRAASDDPLIIDDLPYLQNLITLTLGYSRGTP